ncbi:MAG: TetR/AcrR family transcriptional regulator [Parachlamydiaceae bacterium]|nr:TetR/AcrR family transcriptional regulator [Parachlamydiaceae bacterium]
MGKIGRKAEIIKEARWLFHTKGYDSTTMQNIMERLDIAKGTIYHYFKSKEELFEAVIENIVEENLAEMEQLFLELKGNALEKIEALLLKGNLSSEELLNELHKPANAAMHLRILTAILRKQAPIYAALIAQGCKEGLFQVQYPLESVEMILFSIQFLTDIGIHPWSQEELFRRLQAYPNIIESLLKAPPGSFNFLPNLWKG